MKNVLKLLLYWCVFSPGFENSSLKASFSLSSLPATEHTPEKGVKPRLYNSLTKNRVKATAIRRSWGSTASDHREEFWSVLQANYNYIMDNQLIDKCQVSFPHFSTYEETLICRWYNVFLLQEVDGDLTRHTGTWTLKEFYSQFSELYSWLNSVQETIYGKEENITDKALRAVSIQIMLIMLYSTPSIETKPLSIIDLQFFDKNMLFKICNSTFNYKKKIFLTNITTHNLSSLFLYIGLTYYNFSYTPWTFLFLFRSFSSFSLYFSWTRVFYPSIMFFWHHSLLRFLSRFPPFFTKFFYLSSKIHCIFDSLKLI